MTGLANLRERRHPPFEHANFLLTPVPTGCLGGVLRGSGISAGSPLGRMLVGVVDMLQFSLHLLRMPLRHPLGPSDAPDLDSMGYIITL